ncbi:MAG: hypothetical protein E7208_08025 [Clostridium butyricum]|nr:hypothetical protein [Clostridium butyricum]
MNDIRKTDYENKLDKEIEKRINVMESSDYLFPRRFSKTNYIFTLAVIFLCIIILIIGVYL